MQIGPWEGDTMRLADVHSWIMTMVGRVTGMVFITTLEDHTAEAVNNALRKMQQ